MSGCGILNNKGKGPRTVVESLSARRAKPLVLALGHMRKITKGAIIKGAKGEIKKVLVSPVSKIKSACPRVFSVTL